MMKIIILVTFLFLCCFSKQAKAETDELTCLADNIYYEARGHSQDMWAVGYVTLARVKSALYPNTICEVVYQKSQFSWTIYPRRFKIQKDYLEAVEVASRLINEYNLAPDLTKGSLHYYNYNLVTPNWHKRYKIMYKTKNHVYLK